MVLRLIVSSSIALAAAWADEILFAGRFAVTAVEREVFVST